MNDKKSAKERMVSATIELICEGKKPSEITVSDITERACVGNGMVNYHFQTKDNLMRTAVKRVTVCAKKTLPEKLKNYENAAAPKRLAFILKEVTDFFAHNTEISKIALLDNLENDDGFPHILSDVEIFNNCLTEMYGDNTQMLWIKNYIIAGFLDYIFLKANLIKDKTGFDFYDKPQRDKAIDAFIIEMIHCNKTMTNDFVKFNQ